MSRSRGWFALVALPLLAAGCGRQGVTEYRVPHEDDPQLPADMAAGAGNAPAPGAGSMADTSVPTDQGPSLAWTAPDGWKSKPASAMRKATFGVPLDGAPDADLSVTAFPGDVGGELANVNRWRGQVALPPVDDSSLAGSVTRLTEGALSITVVDLSSTQGPNRILGAIVPYAGGTWFFKLTGPAGPVEKAKPAFMAFVGSLRPAAAP